MSKCETLPATRDVSRFSLGAVLATPGAVICLSKCGVSAEVLLARHQFGDWGDLSPEDARENELSVGKGLRILSSYPMSDGSRIWIITEADRSATTLLLPEEY